MPDDNAVEPDYGKAREVLEQRDEPSVRTTAWRQTLRHRRAVEAHERELWYTCSACGWEALPDAPDHERWSLLDRHDHAEHPARSSADWSEEGLVRYMRYRARTFD